MHIKNKEYLRSVIFGVEDSLVSTTGFLAGISIGSANQHVILLAGLVAIMIEGVSMGVSEYLSDDAMDDLDKLKRHHDEPLISGFLLASSYILAGMIPFLPVLLLTFPISLIISVVLAFISLFLLGYIKAKILNTSPVRSGVKILIVGGITTFLGIAIGLFLRV